MCALCQRGSMTDDGVERGLCPHHLAMLPGDLKSEWLRAMPRPDDALLRRIRMLIAHLESER